MSLMEGVQHLKIPLEKIKVATKNFSDETFIASGGFGKVYAGVLTLSEKQTTVAVKRLDGRFGQGNREFLMEIQMLSCYRHTNLVSLVGFCDENGECILVYEHAKHGSLDRYLSSTQLSWIQRLKISLGAARGFNYLHNDVGPQHRVLHRDIKSSNILLDVNWEAKISDFGLSKIGPSNVEFTFLVTTACGTLGYIDPQYVRTGILTKESDVYSFGVVLFEILCGRLALNSTYQDERRFLASLAQQSYEQNRLDEIILSSLKNEIKVDSLNMFSKAAYECLKEKRSDRPTMGWIVEKLDKALQLQVKVAKKDLDDIDTHKSALGDIIKSLEDDSIQITGIYGLGGVGKTTLAKEVVARVKNTLFAHVAFTTVSQNVDVEKIQNDIGEATKRIMKGDKILIILDDVWEKLCLEDLSISCGSNYMNCKILLTSRSEKVCQKMNVQCKIHVNSLPTEEAWILFKRVVGKRVEMDANLKRVALKVVEECGGLPLLIQAVGNALKYESIIIWELALNRLQKNAPLDIDEEIRKSFTHLKLSYDYLKSEEAKSCFLLCSLFPEDHDIRLEDLVTYGVGLQKFDDLDSIEDARGRVQNAVNILTSSGLLLKNENDDKDEDFTKMHDVVRDVALLIASQGNNKFLVKGRQGLTEWLPLKYDMESYKGISLDDNKITKLPDYEVHLPHLQIFTICFNYDLTMISDEFIGGMKEIKVLDMSWNNISSLPQSFQLLTKLRTLNLRGNKSLHEISILGELTDLEILILNGSGITKIPEEIGRLVNLRVLEVNGCHDLSHITPGVISALSRLEELCIEFNLNFKGASDCIVEAMSLSKLTYFDLTVPSIDAIPAQCFNSEKLKGFVIQIGKYDRSYVNMSRSASYLILARVHLVIPLVKWVKKLIQGSRPITILIGIKKLSNILPTLYDEGFNKLENIQLESCRNVSCIVDDDSCDWDEGKTPLKKYFFMELKHLGLYELNKLEVIWKCPDEYVSLTNLVRLGIGSCNKLERIFTVSVAQGLVNLKELSIRECEGLEEVIYGGGEEIESRGVGESEEIVAEQQHDSSAANNNNNNNTSFIIIVFPSLANIYFWSLPSLKSFFNSAGGENGNGNCSIIVKYPSLVHVGIEDCRRMKMWGPGIHETPNLKTLDMNGFDEEIVLDGPCAINEAVAKLYEQQAYLHELKQQKEKNEHDKRQ